MSLHLLSAYQASSAVLSCFGMEKQHQRLQGFGPSGEDAADSRRPVLLGDSVTVGVAILNDYIDWEASRFAVRSAVVGDVCRLLCLADVCHRGRDAKDDQDTEMCLQIVP